MQLWDRVQADSAKFEYMHEVTTHRVGKMSDVIGEAKVMVTKCT